MPPTEQQQLSGSHTVGARSSARERRPAGERPDNATSQRRSESVVEKPSPSQDLRAFIFEFFLYNPQTVRITLYERVHIIYRHFYRMLPTSGSGASVHSLIIVPSTHSAAAAAENVKWCDATF